LLNLSSSGRRPDYPYSPFRRGQFKRAPLGQKAPPEQITETPKRLSSAHRAPQNRNAPRAARTELTRSGSANYLSRRGGKSLGVIKSSAAWPHGRLHPPRQV